MSSFRDKLSERLSRTRESLTEGLNVTFKRGARLDEDFWDGLEERLILGDVGFQVASSTVEELRDYAARKALPDAESIKERLAIVLSRQFTQAEVDPFETNPACVLFVGINGTGKTTTVGKIAKASVDKGRSVLLGSADTFRAAAIEQLDVWGERAGVEIVKQDRGSDPASVCFETVERAEELGSDLVLIDTSGRLHTSHDLMRELEKIVTVTRKRAQIPVFVVLVIDATTGQNGLQQAREFNKALDLDGLIVTKLDGTAKGGIALAASHELQLPVFRIGVGESIEDLQPFDALEFACAIVGCSVPEQIEDEEE